MRKPKTIWRAGPQLRFCGGGAGCAARHDTANTKSQEGYGLFDAKIGCETERFDIYVYGRNLFDKEYSTRTMENMGVWYGRAGAPQTLGVVLQGRF